MTMRVLAIHHEDWKQYLLRAASRRKHQNLGSLEEAIREAGWRCDYHESAIGQSLRTDLDRYSHVIVLGGNISAYEDDKHGFLREEMRIIERALKESLKKPFETPWIFRSDLSSDRVEWTGCRN